MRRLQGRKLPVQAVAFSPDGRTLASAGNDRLIHLWEPATGKEVTRWPAHRHAILCLAFAPDGRALVSGSYDLKVWDPTTGKERACISAGVLGMGLTFSPDGRSLAAAFGDRLIFNCGGGAGWWDTATWEPRGGISSSATLGGPRGDLHNRYRRFRAGVSLVEATYGGIQELRYTLDGRVLVLATATGIVLWDVTERREMGALAQGGCRSLALSPDGRTVAAADARTVLLWDVTSRTRRATLRGHKGVVWSVAFSPDGALVLSGSKDGLVCLWDAVTGEKRAAFDWEIGTVHHVAFAPDGMTAAAAGHTGTVVVWDVDPEALLRTSAGPSSLSLEVSALPAPRRTGPVRLNHKKAVVSVAFSPDGKTLASLAHYDRACLWDVDAGRERTRLPKKKSKNSGYCVAFSPDGRTLAVSEYMAASVNFWDLEAEALRDEDCGPMTFNRPRKPLPKGAVLALAFSPKGDRLALGLETVFVREPVAELEVRRGEVLGLDALLFQGHGGIADLAFSPDGTTVALATARGGVVLWDVADEEERSIDLPARAKCLSLRYSPDGSLLAAACGKKILLWDLRTATLHATLQGHQEEVRALAFTPDGKTILSGSKDRTVRWWDVESGREKQVTDREIGIVNCVAVAPDGEVAAAGGNSGVVALWGVERDRPAPAASAEDAAGG
jgi:WD40 repeat protein